MTEGSRLTNYQRLITHHGERRNQGEICKVNGMLSLGYREKDRLVGFTTFEEMMQEAYSKPIPEYTFTR